MGEPAWVARAALAIKNHEQEEADKRRAAQTSRERLRDSNREATRVYLARFLDVDPLEIPQGEFRDKDSRPQLEAKGTDVYWMVDYQDLGWRVQVSYAAGKIKETNLSSFYGIEVSWPSSYPGVRSWKSVSTLLQLGMALKQLGRIS